MSSKKGSAEKRQPTLEGIERGRRLRAFRELFGSEYTQEKVAELAGLPERTSVTRVETGWNKGTARQTHEALGRAFHVWPETIADLLDGRLSPAQAHARAGESLQERAAPVTHSPRLRERPEWSTVLPEAASAATAVFGDVPAEVWELVGEVLDSPPFPRPLSPGFLALLARALRGAPAASSPSRE